jgi:hypothetical protein
MEEVIFKKCPLCGAVLEEVEADTSGVQRCRRCGTACRYEGENLVALFIPGYFARLTELERLNKEILVDIDLESIKGEYRDIHFLQKKHLERQGILAEYSMLSYFRPFVEKW